MRTAKDLTGLQFYQLKVIKRDMSKKTESFWFCECSCGKIKSIASGRLTNKKRPTRSCGCLKRKSRFLEGKKFGRLEVISYAGYKSVAKYTTHFWKCKCDCGVEIDMDQPNLLKQNRSCGCQHTKFTALEASQRNIISKYKTHARKAKRLWDISDELALALFESSCHYCGILPSNSKASKDFKHYKYNGIDRIDNKLGYILDNVLPCCKACNFAKGGQTYINFINWLDLVVAFRQKLEDIN